MIGAIPHSFLIFAACSQVPQRPQSAFCLVVACQENPKDVRVHGAGVNGAGLDGAGVNGAEADSPRVLGARLVSAGVVNAAGVDNMEDKRFFQLRTN